MDRSRTFDPGDVSTYWSPDAHHLYGRRSLPASASSSTAEKAGSGNVFSRFLKLGKSKTEDSHSGLQKKSSHSRPKSYHDDEDFRTPIITSAKSPVERMVHKHNVSKKDASRSHSWIYGSVKLPSDLPFGYNGDYSPERTPAVQNASYHSMDYYMQCAPETEYEFLPPHPAQYKGVDPSNWRQYALNECRRQSKQESKESDNLGKKLASSVRKLTWKSFKHAVRKRPTLDAIRRVPDEAAVSAEPIYASNYFFPEKKAAIYASCTELYPESPPHMTASVRVRPKRTRQSWPFQEFGPVPNYQQREEQEGEEEIYHSEWDLRQFMPYDVWLQATDPMLNPPRARPKARPSEPTTSAIYGEAIYKRNSVLDPDPFEGVSRRNSSHQTEEEAIYGRSRRNLRPDAEAVHMRNSILQPDVATAYQLIQSEKPQQQEESQTSDSDNLSDNVVSEDPVRIGGQGIYMIPSVAPSASLPPVAKPTGKNLPKARPTAPNQPKLVLLDAESWPESERNLKKVLHSQEEDKQKRSQEIPIYSSGTLRTYFSQPVADTTLVSRPSSGREGNSGAMDTYGSSIKLGKCNRDVAGGSDKKEGAGASKDPFRGENHRTSDTHGGSQKVGSRISEVTGGSQTACGNFTEEPIHGESVPNVCGAIEPVHGAQKVEQFGALESNKNLQKISKNSSTGTQRTSRPSVKFSDDRTETLESQESRPPKSDRRGDSESSHSNSGGRYIKRRKSRSSSKKSQLLKETIYEESDDDDDANNNEVYAVKIVVSQNNTPEYVKPILKKERTSDAPESLDDRSSSGHSSQTHQLFHDSDANNEQQQQQQQQVRKKVQFDSKRIIVCAELSDSSGSPVPSEHDTNDWITMEEQPSSPTSASALRNCSSNNNNSDEARKELPTSISQGVNNLSKVTGAAMAKAGKHSARPSNTPAKDTAPTARSAVTASTTAADFSVASSNVEECTTKSQEETLNSNKQTNGQKEAAGTQSRNNGPTLPTFSSFSRLKADRITESAERKTVKVPTPSPPFRESPQVTLNPNSLLFHDTTRIRLNHRRPSIEHTFKLNLSSPSGPSNPSSTTKDNKSPKVRHSNSFKQLSGGLSLVRPREPPPPPPVSSSGPPPPPPLPPISNTSNIQKTLSNIAKIDKSSQGNKSPSRGQNSQPHEGSKAFAAANNRTTTEEMSSPRKSLAEKCKAVEMVLSQQYQRQSDLLRDGNSHGTPNVNPLHHDTRPKALSPTSSDVKSTAEIYGDAKNIEIVTRENSVSEIRIYSGTQNLNINRNSDAARTLAAYGTGMSNNRIEEVHYAATEVIQAGPGESVHRRQHSAPPALRPHSSVVLIIDGERDEEPAKQKHLPSTQDRPAADAQGQRTPSVSYASGTELQRTVKRNESQIKARKNASRDEENARHVDDTKASSQVETAKAQAKQSKSHYMPSGMPTQNLNSTSSQHEPSAKSLLKAQSSEDQHAIYPSHLPQTETLEIQSPKYSGSTASPQCHDAPESVPPNCQYSPASASAENPLMPCPPADQTASNEDVEEPLYDDVTARARKQTSTNLFRDSKEVIEAGRMVLKYLQNYSSKQYASSPQQAPAPPPLPSLPPPAEIYGSNEDNLYNDIDNIHQNNYNDSLTYSHSGRSLRDDEGIIYDDTLSLISSTYARSDRTLVNEDYEEPIYDDVLNLRMQDSDSGAETEDSPPPLPSQGPPKLSNSSDLPIFPLLHKSGSKSSLCRNANGDTPEASNFTRTLQGELEKRLANFRRGSGYGVYGGNNQQSSSESSGVEEDYNPEKNHANNDSTEAVYRQNIVAKLPSHSISMARGKFLDSMKTVEGSAGMLAGAKTDDDDEEEPIYEEIGGELGQQAQGQPIYSDAFDSKSIFKGASKNEILSFLESIRDQLSAASGGSSATESGLESTSSSLNRDEKYRNIAGIERNDSGIGSESASLTAVMANQSIPAGSLTSLLCKDCNIVPPDTTQELDSPAQDPSNNGELCQPCTRKRSERKEILQEILKTELNYGRDLKIIRDEFYHPIKITGLLTHEQMDQIFLNVDQLIETNEELMRMLKESVGDATDEDLSVVNVGKIFIECGDAMMTAFETYCKHQASAGALLTQLEKEKDLLRIFLRVSQMENAVLRRMNLPAFLMVPVQRVTRYPLLLARLIKVTPAEHPSRPELYAAQVKIEQYLEQMNKATREAASVRLWRKISIRSNSPVHRRSNSDQENGGSGTRKWPWF